MKMPLIKRITSPARTKALRLAGIISGLLGGLSLGAFTAPAEVEFSASVQIHAQADFYAPLSASGAWVEVPHYGRCWHPARVAVGWRPYCDGHWVWTDCGWYWDSDEPWAWACYHYGSWVYDSADGWIWVPDVEWAPAWVYWRVGGDFLGWAPCPPRGVTVIPAAFVFVDARRFSDPVRPSTVIVNNTTIFKQTKLITEFKHESRSIDGAKPQRVVVNEGPGMEMVQKATGRKVNLVPMRELAGRTPAHAAPAHSTHAPPNGDQARPFDERNQPREGVFPPAERPPTPGLPPGRPPESPGGKGEGKGEGKDHGPRGF